MEYEELSEEQKEIVESASSPEEIVHLASQQGVKLTDEELEDVSAGGWNHSDRHVYCSCGTKIKLTSAQFKRGWVTCPECGKTIFF